MRSAILVLALAACVLGQLHYWAHLPPEELRDALIEWDPAQQRQTQRVSLKIHLFSRRVGRASQN